MSDYPKITSYPESVKSFRALARQIPGWTLHFYPHPETLPPWNNLSTDVAVCGPKDASNIVVVTSGGDVDNLFIGAYVQKKILRDTPRPESSDLKIVLVHALNPFVAAMSGQDAPPKDISSSWKMRAWERIANTHVAPQNGKTVYHVDFSLTHENAAANMDAFWHPDLRNGACVNMRTVLTVPLLLGQKEKNLLDEINGSFRKTITEKPLPVSKLIP